MRFPLIAIGIVLCGCASGGPVRISQPVGVTPPSSSVQALYEAGRDNEVLSRTASPSIPSEEVWFGAQSLLRVGQRAEATEQFRRLRDTAESEAFRRVADVALARLGNQSDALQIAQAASSEFPGDAFVQFEVGVTLAIQGDMAAAAIAFDAATSASPTFAYAYYQAGLAYSRVNRQDLMVARFETFVRLAPSAPERAQVESVLRTTRGGR